MPHALATRRAVLRSLAALGCAASGSSAFAQTYPDRPVRVIIPFGPGGVGDISIRVVAEKLGDKLGRRFFVENMPSPDGIVAGRTVISAAADGYTLLLLTGGTAAALALYNKFPLDVFKDLMPISAIGYFDCLMVVNAQSEFQTFADFLKAARAKPGGLSVGTVTTGGVQSLTTNYFKQASGIDFVIVPFRTTPDATVGLMRNDVQMVIDFYASFKPGLEGGQLRALAWTGATRAPALPDLKTAREQGLDGFAASSWNSLYAKTGTSPQIVATLNKAINEVLADADVKKRLLELGVDSKGSTPAEMDAQLQNDVKRWVEVVARAGIEKH
ncbi:MAG TPA: tripartite tricarboxylate transporter substrate-binding protein [Xanthobacteraceae bacterium]|jgi:tripartite-type tricarboxylate transporter receptor subunit TctC